MKRVIFLDVDGVLNSLQYFKKCRSSGVKSDDIDNECVMILKTIVDRSGADIVLSSTWRRIPQLRDQLVERLAMYGLSIIGDTPIIFDKERGDEIKQWLDGHPEYESFIILDDDSDMGPLLEHLVQTSYYMGGLQVADIDRSLYAFGMK